MRHAEGGDGRRGAVAAPGSLPTRLLPARRGIHLRARVRPAVAAIAASTLAAGAAGVAATATFFAATCLAVQP